MKERKYIIKNAFRQPASTTPSSRLAVMFIIFFSGLCSFLNAQTAIQNNLPDDRINYRIGVGDVLKIVVLKQDILSQDSVRVSNDGTIRMPMLGEAIPVACLTEDELSLDLSNRYKKYILNPQVYVAVKEFKANPVALVGAVTSPGTFQLQRPTRLLELLTNVNGPSLNAGDTVQIIRISGMKPCALKSTEKTASSATDEATGQEIIVLPLAEVMKGDENSNPFVQAGDIIRVPEAQLRQAYIIGNVKSALAVNLKVPVTLSRAIAMAGGVSSGAKTEQIKISRQIPGSLTKTDIVVNLKDINSRVREDIMLEANDIVDVPGPSGFRKGLDAILKSLIPAVTRLPVGIP
jgi:polysaccharide biosynthesis/export protein